MKDLGCMWAKPHDYMDHMMANHTIIMLFWRPQSGIGCQQSKEASHWEIWSAPKRLMTQRCWIGIFSAKKSPTTRRAISVVSVNEAGYVNCLFNFFYQGATEFHSGCFVPKQSPFQLFLHGWISFRQHLQLESTWCHGAFITCLQS